MALRQGPANAPQPIALAECRRRVAAVLRANEVSEANAASVAHALVAAEADGLKGHGLSRVAAYAAQAANGKVDGFAIPQATPSGAVLAIDAAVGFAFPAIDLALDELPAIAERHGIALAAVRRSHHAGVLGHPVEAMARRGFAALMVANTPAAIAPWGGSRALLGTNPIAFAAPTEGDPLVIDLSLSKVARGNIMRAAQGGEPIPEGWALDAKGRPTTDAKAALGGTMVPMGDAKGVALALMVEVLAAGLTGANFAFQASSFLDADGPPPAVGQLLVAIDPSASGGSAAHIAALAQAYEAEPEARLPGARRYANRAKAEREGLAMPQSILDLE